MTQPLTARAGGAPGSPDAEPRRPGAGAADSRSWAARLIDPVRWEPGHQRLAAQPMFAACSRTDIRALARAGDECVVPRGAVLCREGGIGYWLFVVTSGAVQLHSGAAAGAGAERTGVPVATLRAGSHFGDVAIIGFGPQAVTGVVVEDATVFVLGRRHVLDLVHSMPGFRDGLLPGVGERGLTEAVRSLRDAGMAAWQALPPRDVDDLLARSRMDQLPPTLVALPARVRQPLVSSPFSDALVGVPAPRAGGPAPVAAMPLDRRVVAAVVSVVVAALVAFGFAYNPDVLVVRPSATIDVSQDVMVGAGADALTRRAPRGRYLVTAVDIEETSLFGLALATARGEETVPRARGAEATNHDRAGRASYRASQRAAAEAVAWKSGIDLSSVRFRDRGLIGPSAGLVYALLLADLTDVVDVPPGRVVAATGALAEDGRVQAVGFIGVKREVARRSGATLFLVPSSPARRAGRMGPSTIAVRTLDEALAAVGSS